MQNFITDFFRNRIISAELKYSMGWMLDEADAGQAFCLVQTTVVYTTELSVPRQNFLMFIVILAL